MSTPRSLVAAWDRHVGGSHAALTDLLDRHREPHRRYHGVAHVASVVDTVTDLSAHEPVDDIGVVVAAAFFHDAIYEPDLSTNESDSARLAQRELQLMEWSDERTRRVGTLIEATAMHTDPPDADHRVLFDADLAILGSPPRVYDRYTVDVRHEYRHVDDAAWTVGRAHVLSGFLTRTAIYATPTAADRWEERARENLARELEALTP